MSLTLALKGNFRPIIEVGSIKANGFKILKTDIVKIIKADKDNVFVTHNEKEVKLPVNLFHAFFVEESERYAEKLELLLNKFKSCHKVKNNKLKTQK